MVHWASIVNGGRSTEIYQAKAITLTSFARQGVVVGGVVEAESRPGKWRNVGSNGTVPRDGVSFDVAVNIG